MKEIPYASNPENAPAIATAEKKSEKRLVKHVNI
jgi:hypothetical protein